MKILSNAFNIYFPPVINIRESLFDFEKEFSGFAKPFTLIPVPEGTPPEIPRVSAVTLNGHSSLIITLQNAQIVTQYDDEFSSDIDKSLEYVKEKMSTLMSGIDSILHTKYCYAGLSTIVSFTDISDPVAKITQTFIKAKSDLQLYDVATRLTYIIEDTYYLNIEIQNGRSYDDGAIISPLVSLSSFTEKSQELQVTIDINDRFAFNNRENYYSDSAKLDRIFCITKDIVSGKIDKILEGEVVL
jgi:hypothetical protein